MRPLRGRPRAPRCRSCPHRSVAPQPSSSRRADRLSGRRAPDRPRRLRCAAPHLPGPPRWVHRSGVSPPPVAAHDHDDAASRRQATGQPVPQGPPASRRRAAPPWSDRRSRASPSRQPPPRGGARCQQNQPGLRPRLRARRHRQRLRPGGLAHCLRLPDRPQQRRRRPNWAGRRRHRPHHQNRPHGRRRERDRWRYRQRVRSARRRHRPGHQRNRPDQRQQNRPDGRQNRPARWRWLWQHGPGDRPAACACGTARISGGTGRAAFLGGSCSARATGGAACVGAHRTTRAHSFRGRGAAVARPGAQVDDRGLLAVGGEIAQGRHRQARGGPGEIREAHDPGACVLGPGSLIAVVARAAVLAFCHRQKSTGAGSGSMSASSTAPMPSFSLIRFSISAATSGLSRRNLRAFSLPCPIWSPS